MAALADVEKILNPADPTLTGLIPIGATAAGGLANVIGTGAASGAVQAGDTAAQQTVSDAGAAIPGITGATLQGQKDLLNPYVTAGTGALDQLSAGIKPGGGLTDPFSMDYSQVQNDPAYQFALKQGQDQNKASLASQGLDYSGGAARQLDTFNTGLTNQYINQDYTRAENTFRQNQQSRLAALQQLTGTGLTASGQEAADVGHAGDQNVQGTEWTATQIADLQQAKADALAEGDLDKAKAISSTIAGIGTDVSQASQLAKLLAPGAPTNNPLPPSGTDTSQQPVFDSNGPTYGDLTGAGGAASASLLTAYGAGAGAAGAAAPTTAALTMPNLLATGPGLASVGVTAGADAAGAAGSLAGAGAAGADAATAIPGGFAAADASAAPELAGWAPATSSGGGLGSAAVSFLTNPITIGVGAAIIGTIALVKSQAHWEANTITKNFQKPFDDNLAKISDQFAALKQSGQLTPEIAAQTQAGAQQAIQGYLDTLNKYSAKGSDYKKVTGQALATFNQYYGPNGQNFLSQFTA